MAVYLVAMIILCCSHFYHSGMTEQTIIDARANYWWSALVFIPPQEVAVAQILFSVSSIGSAFLGLLFLPPVGLIVFLQSQNFCLGKTLNQRYSANSNRLKNKSKPELEVLAADDAVDFSEIQEETSAASFNY